MNNFMGITGLSFFFLSIFLYSCKEKEEEILATIATIQATDITKNKATSGGTITDQGSGTILAKGVCWNTGDYAPTIADSKTTDGTGPGVFTSIIDNLAAGTRYLYRAYAINHAGTAYGDVFFFNTYNSDAIQDVDGNYYNVVTIGPQVRKTEYFKSADSQIWIAENLKTTKFNDGTDIPNITDNTAWADLTTPGYCWYNNDITHKAIYGALYNWYTMNKGKLCPDGWHVSTHDEWKQMEMNLGMSQEEADIEHFRGTDEGYKLKVIYGWNTFEGYCEGNGSNASGFSAYPVGYRNYTGRFIGLGERGMWGTPTLFGGQLVYCRILYSCMSQIDFTYYPKATGFAVRCIKD